MPKRVAFLIGNWTFRPDSGLLPLQGPENDVAALARLLGDPERGRFEVHEFPDKPHHEILPEIAQALGGAAPDDLVLIYYSGHGKLDRGGRLCLATADTRRGALLATSISARHLRDLVEDSDCDQVVLLLDCCYSGAVEGGLRGDVDSELHTVENARGFYIMTASSDTQAARETELVSGGAVMGRFTPALVTGIESGAADLERKGKVLLSDLRRHLEKAVTGQTPQFFAHRAIGDPLISLSPATALPLLDPGVLADLDAEQWYRRRGAVSALAGVLRDGNAAARAAAKAALQRRLDQERDFAVRAELESALGRRSTDAPDTPAPSLPSQTASSSSSSVGRAETAEEASTRSESLYKAGRYAEAAARAFKVAADLGNANAQRNLGVLYQYGRGVQQSDTVAARLYKLAAEQGNADAQCNLGVLYQTGQGVQQSDTEAARLYRLAADQGNAHAQCNLGVLYEKGQGVQQSDTEAARLYRLAADQGNAHAQCHLGVLYETGRGVQQSDTEAARLYKLAADQGNADAQCNLGVLYQNGRGVQQSDTEAARLYKLAADQGNAYALMQSRFPLREGPGRAAVHTHSGGLVPQGCTPK